MKISELYQLKPQSETFDLEDFWTHIKEIERYYDRLPNERIKTKVLWRINTDYRRYWQLASVWLDDRPFGIIQNAGREGQDYKRAFWTDKEIYIEAIKYLRELIPIESTMETYSLDFESQELTEFYGQKFGNKEIY
ncbi:MAG: hypothetical protein ACREPR_21770 [Brasilonema sp.]